MWALAFEAVKFILNKFVSDPKERADAEAHIRELEIRARAQEAEMEKARSEEFRVFIEATQPKSEHMYHWANTAIGLLRPAMAVFSLVAPFAWPQQWRDAVWMVSQSAPWSIMFLSPLIVWVVGRDALRMFFGLSSIAKTGQVPEEVLPPGLPPQPKAVPALKPAAKPAPKVAPKKPWVPPLLPPVPGGESLESR